MAEIIIRIGNKDYPVGCPDGQEDDVRQLQKMVFDKLNYVRSNLTPKDDVHSLLLVAILLADKVKNEEIEPADRQEINRAHNILRKRNEELSIIYKMSEVIDKLINSLDNNVIVPTLLDNNKQEIQEDTSEKIEDNEPSSTEY